MSIIHAGTFFGDMLPQFSKYCKETVYAFEPVLESYVMARQHVMYNDLKNVMLFHAGLSDKTGHAYIKTSNQNGSHLGGSSYISDSGQLVNTFRIDDMKMKEISVLHFDLEGHEDYAIQGALDKIRSEQPIILMEDSNGKDTEVISKIGYNRLLQTRLIDLWVNDKYQDLAVEALNYNEKLVDSQRL
jgi:FkbM family methyltransferase